MVQAVCDCGSVRIDVATVPAEVNDCQCDWCQRLGALWAYYPKTQVRIVSDPGATAVYQRASRKLEFHRCKVCGLTAYWMHVDPEKPRMGVNTRLMPREVRDRAHTVQGKPGR